ncbi:MULTISPECIES: ketopantoate reductase family protein [Paenibacillus]|uniref:ketopantoate reductase family protein n=1 Tax=Paenibacillus TaxID=44249 RepID=UPI0022B8AFAD|nr:2-dehydropantoate 2-reductase [Paenibacillus caseinilyticus]MCZ8518756.1 2-dehydropantoate 2-reductase [Paenibacillus caseinilyticus]
MNARVTVVGGGALGMLFGGRLAASGTEVELVVRRKEQAERLASEGLHLHESSAGKENLPLQVRPSVRLMDGGRLPGEEGGADQPPSQWVLLAVKQTAITPEFCEKLVGIVPPGAGVVCLQNGIGHAEVLSEVLPRERILLSVTTEGALQRSDTAAVHTGGGTTWIGSLLEQGGVPEDEQKKLASLLLRAGFRAEVSNNIQQRVWQKLLTNAAINPLTAILKVTNGELPQLPGIAHLMKELLSEGEKLAALRGISLDADLWEQVLAVCRATASNRSSMLQDILSGRRTEIGAINGGLLRAAAAEGIRLPANETVFALVRALEEKGDADKRCP